MIERISLQKLIGNGRFRSIIDPLELLSRWPADRPVAHVELAMSRDYFASWRRSLKEKRNRRGEVVLLIQDTDGRVLLHTKSFYPDACFRLPTGGLKPGEAIVDCQKRELYEETGYRNPDGRLLDMVFYEFTCDSDCLPFASYLIQWSGIVGEPCVQDADEDISGFCWVNTSELERIGQDLNALPPPWHEWGRMRAVAHFVAAESIAAN
ncbi:NUDIX hydrolase [candidate division KSB1 bacterium]|nr:NUDIX hydrolase [candidate division KSB1 bacterium]